MYLDCNNLPDFYRWKSMSMVSGVAEKANHAKWTKNSLFDESPTTQESSKTPVPRAILHGMKQ